jgi:hypothetical protein
MVGFFWNDTPPPKPPKKEKPKAIPPLRFWESPDYLPGLEDARNFVPNLFTDQELLQASQAGEKLLFDIEVYPNYCLFAFKSTVSGKVIYFEADDFGPRWDLFNIPKLNWVLHNFCLVNFNGLRYDFPVTAVAVGGHASAAMWEATCMLIVEKQQGKDVYKRFKVKRLLNINQIDLIELTALGPGLKVCAGRLHAPRLQDLPFKPGTVLTENQILILRRYCINDLDNTGILYNATIKQIELREKMGIRYGLDLRSLSDAQMAEAIINSEIKRTTGQKYLKKTVIPAGTRYKYKTPAFIKFQTPLMNHILGIVQNADFEVGYGDGSIIMPEELKGLMIEMGKAKYKIGIGGLHSQEKCIAHTADENYFIADTDATSYYPRLILNAGIAPENLGRDFLLVYDGIVVERISAKQAGNIVVAECLKIVANGTFGKLGSMWSIVYAPNLMLQVTITGQLSILMLAESFELRDIEVISVNTDGIVVRCHRSKEAEFKAIVQQWEKQTGFGTEEIRYKATYSRDINNYLAVYEEPQKGQIFKTKGAYGKTSPKKNAVNEICVEAVKEFIATGKPLRATIEECRDITKFTSMRHVSGGAVKGDPVEVGKPVSSGIYLGKLIRWYYSKGEQGEIIYAKTGNKVALTEGAKPLMDLPESFPEDVDHDWYVDSAAKILIQIGHTKVENNSEIIENTGDSLD